MNKPIVKLSLACAGALLLSGCLETSERAVESQAGNPPDYQRGMYAYTDHCSACHDEGQGGAPLLDDTAAWEGRGRAFPTLLRDHQARGWLRPPEPGAHMALGERSVADAVGYMVQAGGK